MRTVVINELRAWYRQARKNGRVAHITNDANMFSGEMYYHSARAYNPVKKSFQYLVIAKGRVSQCE